MIERTALELDLVVSQREVAQLRRLRRHRPPTAHPDSGASYVEAERLPARPVDGKFRYAGPFFVVDSLARVQRIGVRRRQRVAGRNPQVPRTFSETETPRESLAGPQHSGDGVLTTRRGGGRGTYAGGRLGVGSRGITHRLFEAHHDPLIGRQSSSYEGKIWSPPALMRTALQQLRGQRITHMYLGRHETHRTCARPRFRYTRAGRHAALAGGAGVGRHLPRGLTSPVAAHHARAAGPQRLSRDHEPPGDPLAGALSVASSAAHPAGFWICLVGVAVVVALVAALLEGRPAGSVFPDSLRFVTANAFLHIDEWSVASLPTRTGTPGVIDGALWTPAYEFACYLLIAVWGASGLLRRRGSLLVALVIVWLIQALALSAAMEVPMRLPRRFLLMFLLGAVAYTYRDRLPITRIGAAGAATVFAVAALTTPDYRVLGGRRSPMCCSGRWSRCRGGGNPPPASPAACTCGTGPSRRCSSSLAPSDGARPHSLRRPSH